MTSEVSLQKTTGKLAGWLVSDQTGTPGHYFEIRSGRSFIGSGAVSGERIIRFEKQELSAAHAVLNAEEVEHASPPSMRVTVQDIFSHSGTFITKAGSNDEVRISGPTEMQHGDWIRFGDVSKFQLCLIYGSRR